MDLFLKISVLQANFCWVEDLEKIMSLEGMCRFRVSEGI